MLIKKIIFKNCEYFFGKNGINSSGICAFFRSITLLIEQHQMICVVFLNDAVKLATFTSLGIDTPVKAAVLHLSGKLNANFYFPFTPKKKAKMRTFYLITL